MNVSFSPSGAGGLQFSSQVSTPEGDAEDWVQFTHYLGTVSLRLTCLGSNGVSAEFWVSGAPALDLPGLGCGEEKLAALTPGLTYLVRVQAAASSAGLKSTRFTLTISTLR